MISTLVQGTRGDLTPQSVAAIKALPSITDDMPDVIHKRHIDPVPVCGIVFQPDEYYSTKDIRVRYSRYVQRWGVTCDSNKMFVSQMFLAPCTFDYPGRDTPVLKGAWVIEYAVTDTCLGKEVIAWNTQSSKIPTEIEEVTAKIFEVSRL